MKNRRKRFRDTYCVYLEKPRWKIPGDWNTAGCYTHQNNNPRTLTVSTTNLPSPAVSVRRDALDQRHLDISATSWRVAHAIYSSATCRAPLREPSSRP